MCVWPLIRPGMMILPAASTRLRRRVTARDVSCACRPRRCVRPSTAMPPSSMTRRVLVHGDERAVQHEQIDTHHAPSPLRCAACRQDSG